MAALYKPGVFTATILVYHRASLSYIIFEMNTGKLARVISTDSFIEKNASHVIFKNEIYVLYIGGGVSRE